MTCHQCATELLPGKQFCHACGARALVTCGSCGAGVDPRFRFCPDCGSAIDAAAIDGSLHEAQGPMSTKQEESAQRTRMRSTSSPAPVPEELAAKIRASRGAIEGERKQVTVLFCDLAGSTAMAEKLDPEDYHDLLERYLEIGFREIYRFEGIVNQIAGDGFMALFGAPIAHEDAPQRAVRAALEIQRSLAQLNDELLAESGIELRARVGINTGPVVVGTVGNDLKMDYTAIGDTTNFASRLESLAEPGTVLMSESTSRLVRGLFQVRPLGPVAIKGKAEPVAVFEILSANDTSNPMALAAARGLTPFVGRESELGQLAACFQRTTEAFPQLVSLIGPAGSGKSRLVYELKSHLAERSALFFEARCSAWNQMVPYAPFVAMFRQYFDIDAADSPETARRRVAARLHELGGNLVDDTDILCNLMGVSGDMATELDPEQMRRQTFAAAHRLISAENERVPTVMILEDLQWMDEPSRDMLDAAISLMSRRRGMVVITHRADFEKSWVTQAAWTQIRLRPLGEDAIASIVAAVAGGPVEDDILKLIQGKAEGSPFLAEEITRSLLEDGALAPDHDHGSGHTAAEIRIPGTVQEVIAARLDRLGSGAKRVVQVAAVLGRQFHRRQVADLLDGEDIDVDAELDVLERRGVVHRKNLFLADEFRFGESITQEVAYEGLLLKQRRQLHERAAQRIEAAPGDITSEKAALLAYHYGRSDNRERMVQALLAAAHNAERLPSFPTAAKFYRQGWDAIADDFDRPGAPPGLQRLGLNVLVGLGRMIVIYGAQEPPMLDAMLDRGRRVAEQLDDHDQAARLLTFRGMALMTHGRDQFTAGLALVEEGLATAQQASSPAVRVDISRGLAWSYLLDGRFDLALQTIRWVASQLEQFGAAESLSDLYLGTLYLENRILMFSGDLDETRSAALEIYDLSVYANNNTVQSGCASTLAQIALARGDYGEAIEWAKRSADVASTVGNYAACRTAVAVKVLAMVARGDTIRGTLAEVAPGHDPTKEIDFGIAIHMVINALAAVGEVDLAERTARAAYARAAGRLREMLSAFALADTLTQRGPEYWAEAEKWYEQTIGLAESIGAKATLAAARIGAGTLASLRGEQVTARRQLNEGIHLSRAMGMSHYAQHAERVLADGPATTGQLR